MSLACGRHFVTDIIWKSCMELISCNDWEGEHWPLTPGLQAMAKDQLIPESTRQGNKGEDDKQKGCRR